MKTAERILNVLGFPEASLCIDFVDDRRISELHERWFGDPSATNVVSLQYELRDPRDLIGEIYVSVETARREAAAAGIPADYRCAWLVMHGILHVCGYEHVGVDDEEKKRMEDMEEKLDREILQPEWEMA